ncbi:MAG: anti-sigma factor family protein, partial [Planctomycetota bacterium]
MTCRSLRKYLGAFADGELDTEANAEALEHLNMCPRCAEQVTEIHQMKEAVGRVFKAETAPPELAQRVREAIRNERGAAQTRGMPWSRKLFVPLTMAAALATAVGLWLLIGPGRSSDPSGTTIQARFISDTRDQHISCCRYGRDHHDPSLGRDPKEIGSKLSERLKIE